MGDALDGTSGRRTIAPWLVTPARLFPGDLIHYYKGAGPPLRSLTSLSAEESVRVAEELEASSTLAWPRSRDVSDYLSSRRSVEQRLREDFIARGGRPRTDRPSYFTLGAAPFFEDHEPHEDLRWVRVRLADLPADVVSFTYGDSLITCAVADGTWHRPVEKQAWHGRVYLKDELESLVSRIGLPGPWAPGSVNHYLEAQVWSDIAEPLRELGTGPVGG